MKRNKTRKNVDKRHGKQNRREQVLDAKQERVRGLWLRNGVSYAQLDANDGNQYRDRLEHAATIPQAVLARQALKLKRAPEPLE